MPEPYFDFALTAEQAEVLAVTHAAGAVMGFGLLTQEQRLIAADLDRRILEFKVKHPS